MEYSEFIGIELIKDTSSTPVNPPLPPTNPPTGGPTGQTPTGGGPTGTGQTGPTGTVAGAEFAEQLLAQATDVGTDQQPAQVTVGDVPGATASENSASQDQEQADCSVAIIALLVLNLIAIIGAWFKGKRAVVAWQKYFWIIALIVVLLPVIIYYPQCWLWIFLLITLIITIVVAATTKQEGDSQLPPQSN